MSHTDRLRRSPDAFRQLTGITPAAFDRLLAQLTPRYEQAEARRKGRPGRQRRPGAGRKHALALADRLLMLLIYYRTYTTHAFLGFLFGIDDSAVGRNINPLQPLLAGIFRIPERRVKLDPEDIRELFFDATERPTRRPEEGQREFYSGKKKRHTIKTQVVVVRRSKPPGPGAKPRRVRIAAVCESVPGRMHDKKLYDRSRVVAPPDAKRTGDTGYIGTGLVTPTRKPRGGTLTDGQKEENRRVSRRRVVAEHGIGKMKVWRVAAERYRNPVGRHTLIMKNVAGLHNLMYA
jgi:DDE superfamily endonuclease/Helix-turn-helix of DDE superfamily endonuclease